MGLLSDRLDNLESALFALARESFTVEDEARDAHGRWTTESGAAVKQVAPVDGDRETYHVHEKTFNGPHIGTVHAAHGLHGYFGIEHATNKATISSSLEGVVTGMMAGRKK